LFLAGTLLAEDRYHPSQYKPPEFPFAENHIKVSFLPAARDWERVDIYAPKESAEKKLPCVILFYGGGWGGKVGGFKPNIEALLKRGYVVAVPDYVLGAQQPVPLAIWDGAAAVRFLRANAVQYRIDPERIGAWGFSAGGWLAQYLAPSDSATLFTVTAENKRLQFFPMIEPRPANAAFPAKLQAFATDWGAGKIGKDSRVVGNWITADDPPMFTCHNSKNELPTGAQAYRNAGAVADVQFLDVKNTHVPNGNTPAVDKHGKTITWQEANIQFFDEYLKKPKTATAPEIHPAGGSFTGPVETRIVSVHPDAKIHYTLDETPPSPRSPVYTGPLKVTPPAKLSALVIKPGLANSVVTTVEFVAGKVSAPVITTTNTAFSAKVGQPFTAQFTAQSDQPVRWCMAGKVTGKLLEAINTNTDTSKAKREPAWLRLDPATGVLSGTPAQPGVSVFIVAANVADGPVTLVDAVCVTVTVAGPSGQ
jgi:acetyl esterase/lipase